MRSVIMLPFGFPLVVQEKNKPAIAAIIVMCLIVFFVLAVQRYEEIMTIQTLIIYMYMLGIGILL